MDLEREIELKDVFSSRETIGDLAYRTPVIKSTPLSTLTKREVYLKLENIQYTGSFKVRGAANKIGKLLRERDIDGVVAFSTGNHGRAVSYVASQLGIDAIICMSENVPEHRVEAIKRYGARVELAGSSQDRAMETAEELAEQNGYEIVPPFDDPDIIAGQATVGLEIVEQVPDVDTILVPLSGGGLISGVGLVEKSVNRSADLIGISMERSPAMFLSLQEGSPVEVKEQTSLADNLQGGIGLGNKYTFRMVKELVDNLVLVSEEEIAQGVIYLLDEHSIIAEGSGVVGISALLNNRKLGGGDKLVVVVSGRNIDRGQLLEVARSYSSAEKGMTR